MYIFFFVLFAGMFGFIFGAYWERIPRQRRFFFMGIFTAILYLLGQFAHLLYG